jgi:hypothetical protein
MRAPPNIRVLSAPRFVIHGDIGILNGPQMQDGSTHDMDAKCEPRVLKRFLTQAACRVE